MKKSIITTSILSAVLFFNTAHGQTVEEANVKLSNLSSNSYFNSYDDNSKMVNGLNFMVLVDGSNSNYVTPAFTIKVYIWDGSSPHYVKTFNDAGIYHFGSRTYSNESVDLSSLSLPAGTYRLGVHVDADDDISNPPDDPNDNAYLLDGDIDFTPPSGTGINDEENNPMDLKLYPNPANNIIQVNWKNVNGDDFEKVIIRNLKGQLVREMNLNSGQSSVNINITDLSKGVYIMSLKSESALYTRKLVKQ